MSVLAITRVVLYKHGIGYFEREGTVEGDAALSLTFKQAEVSDVLKSLTVLDLHGGHIASVSYDSTKPLEQLLAEVALSIPDQGSLVGLLPQIKGARIAVVPGGSGSMGMRAGQSGGDQVEGILLGVDTSQRHTADGVVHVVMVSLLTDRGEVRSFDLLQLARLEILDPALRRDLEFYLRTQLSAKKKDARTFTFFAQGQGQRTIRLSYTLEAPVWKATYRILLGEEGKEPMIQGWAVVDNTQDEDWENVRLSLIAGLPVSFVHDLYTPRYIRRPVVAVQETTGVMPLLAEAGMDMDEMVDLDESELESVALSRVPDTAVVFHARGVMPSGAMPSSTPVQVLERKIGDLFEYEIEHPVTIRRNQSALVPIVLRCFGGRSVLLYNKQGRVENPMRCVEFTNTTGLTLEGGPLTVLEAGSYVGEAMLETLKPEEQRLIPYAVELSASVLDNIDTHNDQVHRVVIHRGSLQTYYTQVQQTTYTIHNKSDHAPTLYLDHPRPSSEWTLFDTAAPHEITESYWRFQLSLPRRQVTQFTIKQCHKLYQSFALSEVSEPQLELWLQQRYLDGPIEQLLRQVVELRHQAAAFEEQIKVLQQDRETIHGEQKRIRENLQSLGDRSAEKELRERFVRTLNAQEDRLEQIDRDYRTHVAAQNRCREKIYSLLMEVEYDREV